MNREKTVRMATLAILAAIVVVLQVLASFIVPGAFPITLTLVPIVVGAATLGAGAGALLGATFGVVVAIACVTGTDHGGSIMYAANPILTVALCVLKGAAAGGVAGLVYRALCKFNAYVAVFAAALVAPIVNTGIFCAALALFYMPILESWAAGSKSVFAYVIFGLTGVNFLLETLINVVCGPVILRIIHAIGFFKRETA